MDGVFDMDMDASRGRSVEESDLDVCELLSDSTRSRVHRARFDGDSVVVKFAKVSSLKALERFERELELRRMLDHKRICSVLGHCTQAPSYFMVLHDYTRGTLDSFLHERQCRPTWPLIFRVVTHVAEGLRYLHDKELVHRDLKAENILLDEHWNAAITDFDSAISLRELAEHASQRFVPERPGELRTGQRTHALGKSLAHMQVGSPLYMAPEIIKKNVYAPSADVYSFAVLANEMASGERPFAECRFRSEEELQRAVSVHGSRPRPRHSPTVPRAFRELLEECWTEDPAKRPSAHEIVDRLHSLGNMAELFDRAQELEGALFTAVARSRPPSRQSSSASESDLAGLDSRSVSRVSSLASIVDDEPLVITTGAFATHGRRDPDRMEDRHTIIHCADSSRATTLHDNGKFCAGDEEGQDHFFAVYDGHGGHAASEFCARHLHTSFLESPKYRNDPHSALQDAFAVTEREFLRLADSRDLDDGTTAIVAFIRRHHLYVANLGDSRAVMFRSDFSYRELSEDHRPDRPDERRRIENLGGYVEQCGSVCRVQGMIQITRAIGDRDLKTYLSPVPEIREFLIDVEDSILVLATDGLWDVMSAEAVAKVLRNTVKAPDMIARRLAMDAMQLGSTDNITVLVVMLRDISTDEVVFEEQAKGQRRAQRSSLGEAVLSLLTNQ